MTRKTISELKEEQIRIRLTRHQKQMLAAAAQRAGLDVSSWLRAVGLKAAEERQPKAR